MESQLCQKAQCLILGLEIVITFLTVLYTVITVKSISMMSAYSAIHNMIIISISLTIYLIM